MKWHDNKVDFFFSLTFWNQESYKAKEAQKIGTLIKSIYEF